MGDNQTVIAHANLYVKNLFVNITDYPNFVRGQGGSSDVQYGDVVSSAAADTDVELLLYKSETNYPNTAGHLIRVWYEVGFELKAANATADIIYQLQAKDKDGTWVDMSAAVTVSDIGTSYVAKLIKGYLDIQSGISKLPFEMRLIFQSNESDVDVVTGWSWASVTSLSTNEVNCFAVFDGKIYAGTGASVGYVYNSEGGGWTQETCGGTSKVNALAVYNSVLYAATSGKVFSESGGSWSAISASPGDCRSALTMNTGDGEKLYVGIEDNGCYSFDGSSWVNTNLASGGGGKVSCLANLGGVLYAGAENGSVWKYDGSSSWSETGDLTSATKVYSLAVLDGVLYAGTEPNGKVFKFNGETPGTWTATGTLAGATSARALYVHDDILYAGTGNSAAAFAYNVGEDTWSTASVASEIYILGFITYDDDLYCGSYNAATVWIATITQASGKGIARLKNDEASDGQKTVLEIVGRIV